MKIVSRSQNYPHSSVVEQNVSLIEDCKDSVVFNDLLGFEQSAIESFFIGGEHENIDVILLISMPIWDIVNNNWNNSIHNLV